MKTIASAVAAVALSLASVCASAKSETIKIEIAGASESALEITDAAVLSQFSIWNGPGVSIDCEHQTGAEQPGAFIDWCRDPVSRPSTAQLYTVTFHQGGREPMHEWHRKYVVTYAVDAKSGRGYIYLPGPKDGETYKRNVFSIFHDVEGNWFLASAAWQRSVAPLIERHFNGHATASAMPRALRR